MNRLSRSNNLLLVLVFSLIGLVPAVAFAQGIDNPLGADTTLADLLINLTNWLLGIIAILAVLGIVYGGIRMIISLGDEQGLAAAKKIISWSVIGVVVASLALAIVFILSRNILQVAQLIPIAHAQQPDPTSIGGGLDKAFEVNLFTPTPEGIAQQIITFVLSVVGLIAFVVIVWGGFKYVTSLGDEQKAASAKRIILYGIIGLIIIGLSAVIVNVVISLFN